MLMWKDAVRFLRDRKVLLMGSPLHQWRKPIVGGSPLVRLDLELRLIDSIEKGGYNAIYKGHPDRKEELSGIFKNVELTNFEKLDLSAYDVIVFPHITTSTFSPALCSQCPIIALDLDIHMCDDVALELLRKRVEILPTTRDDRNRILYNEDYFLDMLLLQVGRYG